MDGSQEGWGVVVGIDPPMAFSVLYQPPTPALSYIYSKCVLSLDNAFE